MIYANALHAEARAYRFENGRYAVSDPFWSEGNALEVELLKLGYFCAHTYHGGTYAVWQKGREFIFVILVGSIAWTVEVTGLPNYLQFISEHLGPALAHSDRLPDAELEALREAKAKTKANTKAKAKETSSNAKPASKVTELPAVKADAPAPQSEVPAVVAAPVNEVSCVAAIGVIDDGWRQCIKRRDTARRAPGKMIASADKPLQLSPPTPSAPQKAAAKA